MCLPRLELRRKLRWYVGIPLQAQIRHLIHGSDAPAESD
eukprot:CAMPEP_0194306186 /NCGR_PEP_ID=MMETSP0171-20130528/3429_1 /TAXON_ID=218684 /ORGANISM="Corethron pennatum, Strain L29A3" /LENGTH=38 /DNA_ID= /DNA_START= /DNA_END= /DNA_ORIENTATION=